MKKAGIVIDKWKLPFFKKALKKAGFTFTLIDDLDGAMVDCYLLDVKTDNIGKLARIIKHANDKATRSKFQ